MNKKLTFSFLFSFAILLLILSFLPQISSIKTHPIEQFENMDFSPIIQQAAELSAANPSVCFGELTTFTVNNLWDSCAYYILPLYDFSTKDIGSFGQSAWISQVQFIVLCSDGTSLLSKLCCPKIRDLKIIITPGKNTAAMNINQSILLSAPSEWVRVAEGPINILETPSISDSFTVLTTVSNSTPNLETSADCTWSYTLYCYGKPVGQSQNFTLTHPYMVDCTSE